MKVESGDWPRLARVFASAVEVWGAVDVMRKGLNLRGDHPLQRVADDEFGLQESVVRIAGTLASRVRQDGYTLGIEGAWGSGKSTFANFIADKLASIDGQRIIRFEPWLIGDRSALLAAFFATFAAAIDEIENTDVYGSSFTRWKRKRASQKLSKNLRKYGEYLTALSLPATALASLDPTMIAAATAVGLKTIGKASGVFGAPISLDQLRSQIFSGLKELSARHSGLRFTVVIDDIDRMEPAEAVEILRMVQKAADFPLTTYLICFDGAVLANQVRRILQVEDGRLFFEKIFQDVFHLPPQEPFALRRSLKRKLIAAFPEQMKDAEESHGKALRFHYFLDVWVGSLVRTPRDVARLFDAIAFCWPSLDESIDFVDFLWLQLIKQKHAKLFAWVREYLQNVGAYRDGGRAGDTEPKSAAKKLKKIMAGLGWGDRAYISGIGEFLPGVGTCALSDDSKAVYAFNAHDLARFEADRRLGSPSHWRMYFAFDMPSYALLDADVSSFRIAAEAGGAECADVLNALFSKPHDRPGHFVDLLIDKLLDLPDGAFSQREANGIAAGLASTLDAFSKKFDERRKFGSSELWRRTCRLLQKAKPNNLLDIIETGQSLNWLAYVVRDQGFAYGLPEGDRTYTESQWIGRESLDSIIEAIVARFKQVGMRAIFKMPFPLDVLFCWQQLGDADVVAAAFKDATNDDLAFLQGMDALRGWSSSSSTGISYPLRTNYLKLFIDPDETQARLKHMQGKKGLKKKACELLKDWE